MRLVRFLRLDPAERSRLVHVAAALVLTNASIRVVGLSRTTKRLAKTRSRRRAAPATDPLLVARRTALTVDRVARRIPASGRCLSQSYALWYLLRREGLRGEVCVGLRADQDPAGVQPLDDLEAHAWVEFQGLVLNDAQDVRERFVTFPGAVL